MAYRDPLLVIGRDEANCGGDGALRRDGIARDAEANQVPENLIEPVWLNQCRPGDCSEPLHKVSILRLA
jgi:hypothetical protein